MVADATAGGVSDREAAALTAAVKAEALRVGFDLVGVVSAGAPATFADFQEWLRQGFAGEMKYLDRREEAYSHPRHVMPAVRSVIMLAANYRTADPLPAESLHRPGVAVCLERRRLPRTDARPAGEAGQFPARATSGMSHASDRRHGAAARARFRAGGGTGLVRQKHDAHQQAARELAVSGRLTDRPRVGARRSARIVALRNVHALPRGMPHRRLSRAVRARRPQMHLLSDDRTQGADPSRAARGIGDWLFGCDICQDVCPWNKKSPRKNDVAFRPRADLNPAELIPLLALDEIAFERTFGQTALSRPGRAGVLRNAAIVLGNERDERSVPRSFSGARRRRARPPRRRGVGAGQIGGPRAHAALKSRLAVEDNAAVLSEIEQALAQCPTKLSSE